MTTRAVLLDVHQTALTCDFRRHADELHLDAS
jgi:hypothetical protein